MCGRITQICEAEQYLGTLAKDALRVRRFNLDPSTGGRVLARKITSSLLGYQQAARDQAATDYSRSPATWQ